jgi:hypothetical protein
MNNDDDLIGSDHPLPDDERQILEALVGAMIPASQVYRIPGADDPLILARILSSPQEIMDIVAEGLKPLDEFAVNRLGEHFYSVGKDNRLELLGEFAPLHMPFYQALTSLILNSYYQDDRVMTALGMEARAPFPDGFEVPQGDWSLLDPVRKRDKMYRD